MNVLSIDVALKGLRENLRDRRGLLFLIALPLLLIIVFSFVFGSGEFLSGGTLPHEVVVVNNDVGIITTANNTTKYVNYGSNFTQVLGNATAENSTTHLFHLNNVSEGKADDLLKSRSIDAIFIIPKNFSLALTTMVNNSTRTAITSSVGQQTIATAGNASSGFGAATPGANVALPKAGNTTATILAHGDSTSLDFLSAQGLLTATLDQYTKSVQENATTQAAPGGDSIFENYASVGTLPMTGTESSTAFDGVVPGLIVFALLLQMSVVSSSLVRDTETGMLDRLKLSKIRSFDLLSGTFLTWALITIAQMLLLVGVAVARGYDYQGGAGALGLAVLIGVIAGMASIALALIIASFA
ncbi:MAG: ABC transporter permease, partial [Halobacteriota archaeon]